jgi:hypothetical protein
MAENKTVKQESSEYKTAESSAWHKRSSWLVPGLLIVIILLLIAGMSSGWNRHDRPAMVGLRTGGAFIGHGEGGRFSTRGPIEGSNQSRLMGVVTSLNGTNFTIAGGGSTNDITTNSSTQYENASSVKVNDSVLILGTTTSGTFTASQVIINP